MKSFFEIIQAQPFLKILIPFGLGIGGADACLSFIENQGRNTLWLSGAFFFFSLLLLLFVGCVVLYVRRNYIVAYRIFGLILFAFFFVLGIVSDGIVRYNNQVEWQSAEVQYTGVVLDTPHRDTDYTQVRVWVVDAFDGKKKQKKARIVQLSLANSGEKESCFVGQTLVFYTQLKKPRNAGNPEEFDYVGYLLRQGVTGQAVVQKNKWKTLLENNNLKKNIPLLIRVRVEALRRRDGLRRIYEQSGLSGDELSVLSALTLGDKSTLSKSLRKRYSEAGASHLLALSGLHLGILMTMLNFLFLRWGRYTRFRWIGVCLTLLFIWGFTLLAGLPASLLRAATMYTLLVMGSSLQRKGFTLNSLFLSAFIMLFCNPFYLFDVGFQLSFTAMLGILLLQPRLEVLWTIRHTAWHFLWQMITVSFSAQVATAPLVAYYFNTISLYALPISLLLIPLTTLIVWGAVSLLLFSFSSTCTDLLYQFINTLVKLQHFFLDRMNKLPGAVCGPVYPDELQITAFYAMLLLLLAYGAYRRSRILCSVVLIAVGMAIYAMYRFQNYDINAQIVFYNQRNNPAVQLIYSPFYSYLITLPVDSAYEKTQQIASGFWARRLKKKPLWIAASYSDERVKYDDGLLYAPGMTLLMLHDDTWNKRTSTANFKLDYLYLCRGYKGRLTDLAAMFKPKCVVLDASLGGYYSRLYRSECAKLGWKCHAIREQGALKIALRITEGR